MNIKSEETTYLFCQLLNEGDKDVGSSLFVEHLYKSGQLKHLKLLFDKKIELPTNEDIPYLVAIENVLEKFVLKFDGFLSSIKRNENEPVHKDIVLIANSFIDLTKKFVSDVFTAHSLEKIFNVVATYSKTSNEYLSRLTAANSNLVTNLSSGLDFLRYLKHLSLDDDSGVYLCYKRGLNNE